MENGKILIFTAAIFLAILLSGCINQNKNITDCGTDDLCFADNIEKCQPAKVTFTISDDFGSEVKYEEIYGEEKLGEETLCSIYIKVIDENIMLYEEEKYTDLGKKLIEISENIKNKDMLCKIKVDLSNDDLMYDIASTLKNLDPTTKTFIENCNGPLKDEIITRAIEIQKILQDAENSDISENNPVYDDYYGEI